MSLKVAVFTDVHSNTFALEAVLADIRQEAPDLLVNLGDQIWGQVDPLDAAGTAGWPLDRGTAPRGIRLAGCRAIGKT